MQSGMFQKKISTVGFFNTVFTEFGKKTGKALGNKLYGAYADDRRVGVNRGALKGESDGLKISVNNQNRQAEIEREKNKRQDEIEQNREIRQAEQQGKFDDILNITLDPTNKDELLRSLTTLSIYADMWAKESNPEEHLVAAKSKFDTGVALLQAIDPQNPMVNFFLQKQKDLKAKKKRDTINMILFMVGILAFLIVMYFVADKM